MPKDKLIRTISCGTCLYRPAHEGGYEVLLVRPHRDRPRWGIPKGHIDPGETIYECAIRETYEETGYTPVLLDPLPDVRVKHAKEHKTVKSFLATVSPHHPVGSPDGENFDVKWFHYDSLPDIHRYQIYLLEAAVSILKTR